MRIFNIFKKKVVVEEEAQVNQTEEFAFNVVHATYDELFADNDRLKEIIWQLEMAHADNQVIINAMSKELNEIKKTKADIDESDSDPDKKPWESPALIAYLKEYPNSCSMKNFKVLEIIQSHQGERRGE